MELFSSMNIVDAVIDEIALEGLDGITLEALWDRIAMRYKEKVPLPQKLMEQIWNICLQVGELSFYELETPREKLVIFDRYEFVDPDMGLILEPDVVPNDIYPHCLIDDTKNGIKGSCSSYSTRKDISDSVKSLSMHEAEEKYGRSLVIVASQAVRESALMDQSVCPTLDITGLRYCFLERVGRARYQGEVTQGKLSLGLMKEDPKTLFYHRQYLLRHKLITKQMHHQKSGRFSCSGTLMHLPRFFVERKPKVIYLAEKVIEILKSRENHVAEYSEIKKELRIANSLKKLFKTVFFQSVVKTDLLVPYRTLYPHAEKSEWQTKNNPSKEKMLRVVQLIDNDMNISDLWTKDEIVEDDDPFELDITEQKYCVPFMRQANAFVEAKKQDGMGQSELARKMGLGKLQARTICRNLTKLNIVATYMTDMGRQRVTKYVSRKFSDSSRMSKQFKREMSKIKELTTAATKKTSASVDEAICQSKTEESKSLPEEEEKAKETRQATDDEKKTLDEIRSEGAEKKSEEVCPEKTDNTRSYDAATRILEKYKLTNYRRNYKRTFKNVAGMEDELAEAANRRKRPRLIRDAKDDEKVGKLSESKSKAMTFEEFEEKLSILQPATPQRQDNYIVGLMKNLQNADSNSASTVSYRLLKRARIIIESVKELKVIDDMTKLLKVITEEEEREGYDVKIDKKSLIRLLQRLAKDELVKNIKLTLSTSGKEKSLTFICDPSIDVNHTVIRSAVEQAKIKFCLLGAQKVKTILQSNTEKLELSGENAEESNEMEKLNEIDKENKKIMPSDLVFDRKAGRHYGYSPKFIRMQTLHAFLFYLIYEHAGKPRVSQEKLLQTLRNKHIAIDESLEKELQGIYSTEIGWKMFVPPLPKHNGWPLGWALMCDILLRIPLSIFLKIHKVAYRIPDLENYTNHPIRRHLLVKDMPAPIRNILLMRRKYIFSVHDAVTRLCYVGLVQFGPQKLKEKDKVFIYLNRKTELMDTTTSAAHYHQIEAKEYPVTKYTFTSLQTIDKYWYKLWSTCISTRLGGRLVVQGKDIVLEELDKKTAMIEATKARSPEEASSLDVGHVPGDRMGAAGIDSAFFAHLKRNWNWDSSNYPFQKGCGQFSRSKAIFEGGERDAYMAKVRPKPLRFTEFHGLKRVTGPVTMDAVDLKKPLPSAAKNSTSSIASGGKKLKKPSRTAPGKSSVIRQRSYVRRVLPRRRHIRPRVKYDEIDYSALQRMDKLRVDWDTREDNILLVCKVAMMYLCPNPRRQLITFTAVRDVLRSYSISSFNKTSRACQRRLLYIMKKPQTFHSVTLGVEELKQNFHVNRRFGDIVDKMKKEYRNPPKYDEQLSMIFRDLVTYIAKKHYDISDIQSSSTNYTSSTVEEFKLFHRIKYPTKSTSIQGYHDETTNDIHSSTINSVIHSSMCCGKDRRSWAYQLFRIYQQYPEWLLRSAMAKIRTDQMVTIKKHYVFAMRKQANACMPMSSSQYQLSSGYTQKFNTKLPYSVFKESWEFFIKLVRHFHENFAGRGERGDDGKEKNRSGIETGPVNGGTIAAIHDYINVDRLDFDIEIPQHIIMLDPTLQKDDERYIRIARRYQDILRNLEHFQMDPLLDELDVPKSPGIEITEVGAVSSKEKTTSEIRRNPEVAEKSSHGETSARPNVESSNLNKESYARKILGIPKRSQEANEAQANTDTEVFGSDHEVNFEEEEDGDDSWDDTDAEDPEDNDLICFLDGTKIRLTDEDIERSGLKIESENVYLRDFPPKSNEAPASKISKDNFSGKETAAENCSKKESNGDVRTKDEDESSESDALIMDVDVETNEKENGKDSSMRVNEIIERSNYQRDDRGPYYRTADPNDVDKRYTRIALLKMREELNDLTPNDSHHAHEHFVLNMFKLFYSLQETKVAEPSKVSTIHELKVPTELLPLKKDLYSKLLEDLKKFAMFPRVDVSYKKFRRELRASAIFKRAMDAVYEFLRDKREVGACLEQLATKFYPILGDSLDDILRVLKEGRLILRSGVKITRYIHQTYADPWLIHSYKIMRLQREAQQIVPAGSMYVVADGRTDGTNETQARELSNVIEEMEEDDDTEKDDSAANECEATQSSQRKMQKSRTCLLQTKEVYRAAKQLDLDTAEEIRVVVRPWIRVDGDLNRRVLDRMLGGVLAYCLIHPGVYLTKVQEKFAPAIQPFHTKELVEMLVTLECLQFGTARKTRVTLFSKSSSAKPVFSSVTERCEWPEKELVIEPVLGATLKFAMFLSNRTYTSDFLDNGNSPAPSATVRNR